MSRRAERRARVLPRPSSYALGLLGFSVTGQVGFLVALRVRELGGGFDDIGLIAGVTAVVPGLFAVASGPFIDRIGSLRAFIGSTVVAVAAVLTMMTFTDLRLFLISGPVFGIASLVSWVSSQLHIASLGTGIDRVVHTGRFSAASNFGDMAGPLLAGAAAQQVGPRLGLLVPAVYASVFIVLGLRLLARHPERRDADSEGRSSSPRPSTLGLLRLPALRLALVLSMSRLWSGAVFLTFAPVFLVDSGLSEFTVGTVLAFAGLVAGLTSPLAGWMSERFGELRLTRAILVLGAGGVLILPGVAQLPAIYLVPLLLGVSNGLSLPLLIGLAIAAVPLDRGGAALGLRASLNQVSASAAPVAIGPLLAAAGPVVGFAAAGLSGAAIVALASAVSRR